MRPIRADLGAASSLRMLRRAPLRSFTGLSRSQSRPYSTEFSDERWPGWQPVIGIEVHAQIRTRRKLFSSSLGDMDYAPPNYFISMFDAAFPGTLPVLNKACVDLGTRTALALKAQVHEHSSFDRKHYFYPDLPAGYQITQHYSPLATGGNLFIIHTDKKGRHERNVRIKQIQLEQDTAKSTNQLGVTLIDLNRAGVPLMEIVSEPDMRSPEEAGAYVTELRSVLRAIGASKGNMEEGSLRCDVNVSVHRPGEPFGTRCEIKNLNTIKGLQIAITSEIRRHISLLSSGGWVAQETRGFDEDRAETFSLRSKEDAPDYRYMPDPNLPPLIISPEYIRRMKKAIPPLPNEIRKRLAEYYKLSDRDINVIMGLEEGSDVPYDGEWSINTALFYFESIAKNRDPKVVANWITNDLVGALAWRKETFSPKRLPAEQLGTIIDLVQAGDLTATSGKTLLRHLLEEPTTEPLSTVIDRLNLRSTGVEGLEQICQSVSSRLQREADSVRKGNLRVLNRLVGQVMKESQGRADAQAAAAMLKKILGVDGEGAQ